MLDNNHLRQIAKIVEEVNPNNIGDLYVKAVALYAGIMNPKNVFDADNYLSNLRDVARKAELGWKIFKNPLLPNRKVTDEKVWQLVTLFATLNELIYCFEEVTRASYLTWARSTPVRFYVNGLFHYLSALYLLGKNENEVAGLAHSGTVVKVLQPLGLNKLLEPIYQIFEQPFGTKYNYGETVRLVRNRHFVHGSLSPKNIKKLVRDSQIFNEEQEKLLGNYHWAMWDQTIIFKLKIIAILTALEINLDDYPVGKLYGSGL